MPDTLRLRADDPADVARAADLLRAGRLVAFATETVYGLGASALSAEAVARIFAAKQRPSWDPLIVHIASLEDLPRVAILSPDLRDCVERLARAFWPGPLTMLLPKAPDIPDAVTAGRPLVGVRIPAHPAALELLRAANIPVAAPSANRFGHTSPTTADHVIEDLGSRIEAVLDAGPTRVGIESTVVDLTRKPIIQFRPGAITPQDIQRACGTPVEPYIQSASADADGNPPESLPSPGVGIRHYAPRARVILTEGSPEALLRRCAELTEDITDPPGVLLPVGWRAPEHAVIQPWAVWDDPSRLAATLFAGLRALDARGVNQILCPLPPTGGLYDAIRDRLQKAAREK